MERSRLHLKNPYFFIDIHIFRKIAPVPLMKLEKIKRHCSMVFKIKDLGEPVNYLGMKIIRDRDAHIFRLNQTEYIDKILTRFNKN